MCLLLTLISLQHRQAHANPRKDVARRYYAGLHVSTSIKYNLIHPLTFARQYQNSRLITLEVGDTGETFQVQEALLRRSSDFFVKALNTNAFVEGQTGKIKLQESTEDVIRVFCHFLHNYGTTLDFANDIMNGPGTHTDGEIMIRRCTVLMFKTWVRFRCV